MNKKWRRIFGILVLGIAVFFLSCVILETAADARAGGGRSSGSRGFSSGSRSSGGTYNYNRSTPYQSTNPTQGPATPQKNTYSPGRGFLYGLGGGLAGSMLGSLLFGRSGYGGMAGYGGGFGFGDFILLLVIAGVLYWAYKRYKAKRQMQMNSSSQAGYSSYAYNEQPAYDYGNTAYNSQPRSAGALVGEALSHIAQMDPSFNENAFCEKAEDLFFKIQGGWTRRDLTAMSDLLTPQMRDTFQADIDRYMADKKINRLENIAVRQVEIVDAVQDQGQDYITVRYTASLLDFITDESGNVLSGSSTDPVKFLEYWTYTRKVGERNWHLAAITQEQDYN